MFGRQWVIPPQPFHFPFSHFPNVLGRGSYAICYDAKNYMDSKGEKMKEMRRVREGAGKGSLAHLWLL